ncbi:SDR family oxidoreductase [Microcoleus sp. FACHB-1515]|uniref:SDR family oxidoreductase n=1 Tax=Cyanophyceae TaxID=3028117 RepID=UPI001681DBE7|nr:SDR family oxidoreductase [Microcoleus sp. FACHB-1515]MBD2092987.1 SDR family oxidoreductase [Microcoleus sp. FACHB-1515]
MQLKPIRDQVAVIVGASSGIGRITAKKFAQQGAKVVAASRSIDGLTTLVGEIHDFGGEAIAVPADVAEYEQVEAIAAKAVQEYGRIDTWVHAAATGIIAPFDQLTPQEFKRVIDVNLNGQAYGAMAALPHLKREGQGSLIHITSVEARRSLPYQSVYSASKHGVEGFLDAMRLELMHEGYNINVANILPAVINTPYYNKVQTKLGVKPTGVPPYYSPELVADSILYAAEHPTRDMIVGDVGRVVDLLQRIAPKVADSLLLAIAFPGQKTPEPKSADSPSNVFEAVPPELGYDRVEGDFGQLTIPSFLDWFDRNPIAKWGTTAALAATGIAVLLNSALDKPM